MMQMRVSYVLSGIFMALGGACFVGGSRGCGAVFLVLSLLYYVNGLLCEKKKL